MIIPQQLPLDLPVSPAYGVYDFLPSASNAEALAWIKCWPAWDATGLVLWGEKKAGKTHLAHIWRKKTGAVYYTLADIAEDVPALVLEPQVQAVVVDNVGENSEAAHRFLLPLYNIMVEKGGAVLLVASKPAVDWPITSPALVSRVKALPHVEILPPDDGLLTALLIKQFTDRQILVSKEVIEYLATHMERSFDAASRLVDTVDKASLAARRKVTVGLVKEVLAEEKLLHRKDKEMRDSLP